MNKNFRFVLMILFGLMIMCIMECMKIKKLKKNLLNKNYKTHVKTKIIKSSSMVKNEIDKMKKFILDNKIKSSSKAIRILERAEKMLE